MEFSNKGGWRGSVMSDFPLRKKQQQQQQHMGLIHWILPNNNLRHTYSFSSLRGEPFQL